MTDNDTSALNSAYTHNITTPSQIEILISVCVDLAVLTLTAITAIIGFASWLMIKKFRNFKNYVFLNIILNNILNILLDYLFPYGFRIENKILKYTFGFSYLYFKMTVNCWMLVMCYLFYMDLVKIIGVDVKRKYLRSTIFAWGLPMFITVWDMFVMPYIGSNEKTTASIHIGVLFLPLIINLLIYIRVVHSLWKAKVRDASDRCRKFQVITVIFFISGTILLLMPLRSVEGVIFPPFLPMIIAHLQTVTLDIYFLVVRMNRKVWSNYRNRTRTELQ